MKSISFSLYIAIVFLFTGINGIIYATPTPTPTPILLGSITGRVTDAIIGKGINGATVTLEDTGIQSTTGTVQGQDGIFVLNSLLPLGSYEMTASAEGYITSTQTVTVAAGNPNPQTGVNIFDFALVPEVSPTPTPGHPKATTTESWGSQCGATFNGIVNANGLLTTVWFEVNKDYDTYTSSTETVTGWNDTPVTISEDFSENLWDGGSYPFRIVAQNSAGITYGNEEEITIFYGDKICTVTGYVFDKTTHMGIANATIIPINPNDGSNVYTDASGYYEWSAYEFPCSGGCYTLAVSANGYAQSLPKASCQGLCDGAGKLDFELKPLTIPSPTPTPLCEADSIDSFPKALKLKREEIDNVTITVLCEDGSPVVGQTVTAKIKSDKKRITVSPQSTKTDPNGQAIFTITATNKTGNAKVKFETTNGLTTTVPVKVRGR